MIFSKFFHLSREGSKTIMQAGIWLAVFNLAALLPVVLLAMISEDRWFLLSRPQHGLQKPVGQSENQRIGLAEAEPPKIGVGA